MQLSQFKSFLKNVISEGNRLQKVDITGTVSTKKTFTQTQILSIVLSVGAIYLIKTGFSDNFAGYVISFLSIFIGLFSSIVISLFDKSSSLSDKFFQEKAKEESHTANHDEIARLKKIRNYLVQFTGLTSYAIFLAICIIVLLLLTLLHDFFKQDITTYSLIKKLSDLNKKTVFNFFKVFSLLSHRFLISYFLLNFFVINLYAVTSYFSYISSEYKNNKFE